MTRYRPLTVFHLILISTQKASFRDWLAARYHCGAGRRVLCHDPATTADGKNVPFPKPGDGEDMLI